MAGCREKETIEHLLLCPMYERQRREELEEEDVIKILKNNPERVLVFLRRIGRTAAPDLQ